MTTLINEHYIKPNINIPIEKIHDLFKIETQKEFKPWDFSLIKTYNKFIKPYIFTIIAFVVFAIFLFIKYKMKQLKNKKNKKTKKHKKKSFDIKYSEPIEEINEPDVLSVDELKSL